MSTPTTQAAATPAASAPADTVVTSSATTGSSPTGPLSSPRSGGDSTPSGVETSRTDPVRDPWMPTPCEIKSCFGSTAASSQCALSDGTGIRRLSRDVNGYTGIRVPEELNTLRANLIAQRSSSAGGGRSTLSGDVGDLNSRSSFTPFCGFGGGGFRTPSPFLERPASGRSVAPTYRGSEEILSNEYEIDQNLGSGSDDQQFAVRSSELPPVCLAVGLEMAGSRRGSGPPDFVDHLGAVERLQTAEFAALRQELALFMAQLAQVSQTASNVQVDLGPKLAVLRTRVGALEQASAPRHQY
ncbi:unnamed protein product [Phytophthora fragariaefolia]|uniref:Unnamed protein product n=1 Tax=Phytophthora fragariaefolia TaxID=1490495 RepID=A0A9W6X924_9STRA|nr:unnamed protein product [Phytophthora fragariaefolia]